MQGVTEKLLEYIARSAARAVRFRFDADSLTNSQKIDAAGITEFYFGAEGSRERAFQHRSYRALKRALRYERISPRCKGGRNTARG